MSEKKFYCAGVKSCNDLFRVLYSQRKKETTEKGTVSNDGMDVQKYEKC